MYNIITETFFAIAMSKLYWKTTREITRKKTFQLLNNNLTESVSCYHNYRFKQELSVK